MTRVPGDLICLLAGLLQPEKCAGRCRTEHQCNQFDLSRHETGLVADGLVNFALEKGGGTLLVCLRNDHDQILYRNR